MGLLTKTFSYDARVVRPNLVFAGWTLPLRSDCDGVVPIASAEKMSWIYITNMSEFMDDMKKYNSEDTSVRRMRGMQFDCIVNLGLVFESYTYEPGTMRGGGFSRYALK